MGSNYGSNRNLEGKEFSAAVIEIWDDWRGFFSGSAESEIEELLKKVGEEEKMEDLRDTIIEVSNDMTDKTHEQVTEASGLEVDYILGFTDDKDLNCYTDVRSIYEFVTGTEPKLVYSTGPRNGNGGGHSWLRFPKTEIRDFRGADDVVKGDMLRIHSRIRKVEHYVIFEGWVGEPSDGRAYICHNPDGTFVCDERDLRNGGILNNKWIIVEIHEPQFVVGESLVSGVTYDGEAEGPSLTGPVSSEEERNVLCKIEIGPVSPMTYYDCYESYSSCVEDNDDYDVSKINTYSSEEACYVEADRRNAS